MKWIIGIGVLLVLLAVVLYLKYINFGCPFLDTKPSEDEPSWQQKITAAERTAYNALTDKKAKKSFWKQLKAKYKGKEGRE